MKVDFQKLIEDKEYCEKIFKYFLNKKIIKENKLRLFEKHINKSISNLEFSNYLIEEQDSIKNKLNKTFYDWCITIYYYSLYHASLALVSKAGFESKNHTATITIITLFYYHKDNFLKKEDIEFIIENISLNKEDIDLVLNSKDLRERACYGVDQTFELNQAINLRTKVVNFINKIRLNLDKTERLTN